MNRKHMRLLFVAIIAAGILSVAMAPRQALAQTAPSVITIDAGPGDFPYGINCDDANYVYVTLFRDGKLAKIDKDTKAVLDIIDNPQTGEFQQGFYSVARDASGNLWINERDGGKVWKYEPASSTWTPIPIVEEIAGNSKVTYPKTYELRPNLIRIDENPSAFGVTTYLVSLPAFGGVISANGYVYVGLGYSTSFHDEAFTLAGVENLQFAGLAKIDPLTDEVTRIAIPGAFSPTGLSIDVIDSNVLWITDQFIDKVYKYDLSSNTLLETIELDTASRPRGIDNNGSEVFIALNKDWSPDAEENSKILRISKADTSSRMIIDTGAPNNGNGAFTVFVVNDHLLWTDQSQHVGLVNLSTNVGTYETTEFSSGNHFGCLVGDEFWWAGHGSAVVGTISFAELQAGAQAGDPTNFSHLARKEVVNIYAGKINSLLEQVEVENEDGSTSLKKEFVIPDTSFAGQSVTDEHPDLVFNEYSLYDVVRGDPLGFGMVADAAVKAGIDWESLSDMQKANLYIIVMWRS